MAPSGGQSLKWEFLVLIYPTTQFYNLHYNYNTSGRKMSQPALKYQCRATLSYMGRATTLFPAVQPQGQRKVDKRKKNGTYNINFGVFNTKKVTV